jgi:hypothetical protein
MYTGELLVDWESGDSGDHDFTFQYPVLGTFWGPGGTTVKGIMPINTESAQFRSAIAYAAVTSSQLGDTPVWADVGQVSADLFKIELDPSRDQINAVVLSGKLTARNSKLTAISYRVSVLERMNRQPTAQGPRLIDPGWNGKYVLSSGDIGPLLKNGIPQDFLEVA